MRKAYNTMMEHIKVNDEMRRRVLQNVQNVDLTDHNSGRSSRFSPGRMRRALSLAACLALLVLGTVALPGRLTAPDKADDHNVADEADIVEAASLQELGQKVGFSLNEVENLPFEAEEAVYTAYWSELAEITYTGENAAAIYRKSAGSEDNSGDYSEYNAAEDFTMEDCIVTLKGDTDHYTLAVWTRGDYSYSLNLSTGLSRTEWEQLIAGIE